MSSSTTSVKGPVSTRQTSRFYRPELDVLRFSAFLLVFIHHTLYLESGPSPSPLKAFSYQTVVAMQEIGAFGVCLFFLLSAFLITELLCREFETKGKVDVRAFYVRRILRIWPLYFSFLAFCAVVGWLVPSRQAEAWRYVAFILLSGNWYCAFFGYTLNPMSPLWSVSVEEQFYLLWPTVARFNSKRILLFVALAVIFVSNCSLLYLGLHHADRNFGVWTNSFVQFYFFAIGAILALCLNNRVPISSTCKRSACVIGGLLCWLVANGVFRVVTPGLMATASDLLAGYFCLAAGASLIFLGVLGLPSRFLPTSLIYLGKISYGLYLFHSFAGILAGRLTRLHILSGIKGAVACLFIFGVTVALASISYRWFETPFLRMKRRFTVVDSRPV